MSSGKWRPFCLGLNMLSVDKMLLNKALVKAVFLEYGWNMALIGSVGMGMCMCVWQSGTWSVFPSSAQVGA